MLRKDNVFEKKPLCIDCDGTLIATDLLYEAFFLLLKQNPLGLFYLPFWLLKGKVYLKERLSEHVTFRWETLPYRKDVIDLINLARSNNREVVLVTASPLIWAQGIAKYLNCFDKVFATENGINLSGINKAKLLVNNYGQNCFDYAGDSYVDCHVWQQSASIILVSSNLTLYNRLSKKISKKIIVINPKDSSLFDYIRALRLHQWLKNLLVFVPLLAAHKAGSISNLVQIFYAFLAFSTCASAVYLLNDLLDLDSDRQHVRKKLRPFASGAIPLKHGLTLIPVLLAISIALSMLLPNLFLIILIAYFLMTVAYSIRLKKQVIVDVMILAGLYTMRIIAGAAAIQIKPSFWLLAFSIFIFLSLALIKRYSELLITLAANKKEPAGRGYSVDDLPVLMSIGVSTGVCSVLILALYLNTPETYILYKNSIWLWLIPPILLYWTSRMWMKAHRGQVDDDPIIFAAKDWQSLVVLFLTGCIFILAVMSNV